MAAANEKPGNVHIAVKLVDDFEFEAENASGNRVAIDMHPPEQKQHQSPTELLLSALAACASVDLVQILKKRRRQVDALTVRVNGTRKDETPRKFTHINLHFTLSSPDTPLDELEKYGLLAATKYCSVSATLNAEMTHTFSLTR